MVFITPVSQTCIHLRLSPWRSDPRYLLPPLSPTLRMMSKNLLVPWKASLVKSRCFVCREIIYLRLLTYIVRAPHPPLHFDLRQKNTSWHRYNPLNLRRRLRHKSIFIENPHLRNATIDFRESLSNLSLIFLGLALFEGRGFRCTCWSRLCRGRKRGTDCRWLPEDGWRGCCLWELGLREGG